MSDLENPSDNPCFGCGPQSARGLHLNFREEVAADGSAEIRGEFSPRPDEIGWPTLFHHGLHFTVLYEASYWAALTLGGKVWISHGPISYTADRLPRVGAQYSVSARIVAREESHLRVEARTFSGAGKPCGTLESDWRPASLDVVRRAGVPLPEYLARECDP